MCIPPSLPINPHPNCPRVISLAIILMMLEISDDKIWQATKLLYRSFKQDDLRERLDPDHLKQFKKDNIKPLYPHKLAPLGTIEKYTCCQSCCTVDPGSFCCCASKQPDSSFRKLGLGLCLYFKFMKHSATAFCFVTFLSILSCLICYLVANQNGFNPTSNYQTFLFSTTLGTFSSEHIKCQYNKIPSVAGAMTFSLSCPYGRVNYFGATYSTQSSNTLNNCKNQIRNYQSGDVNYVYSGAQLPQNCSQNGNSCSITLASVGPNGNFTTVSYSYECLDQVYSLGLYEMKSQHLLYIVVGIDFLCCLIVSLFYCSQSKAQQEQITYFKQSQLSLNDFSLKFSGFNIATFDEQFNAVVKTLTRIIGDELPGQLVQVKIPDREDFVEYQNKKNQAYEELYQCIRQQYFDTEVDPTKYKSAKDFIESIFEAGQYDEYKEKLLKLISDYYFLEYNPDQDSANKNCSIFIVLNSIRTKKRIYEMQKDGCFKKYYQINNREYVLSQPPPPDLIIWRNKGKFTFIRLIISWIITLAICGGSYVLFAYIQYQQNRYLSTYNFNLDCSLLYAASQLTTYMPIAGDNNYLTCFCKNNLLSFDYTQCNDFQKAYVAYLAIPVVISFLLVIYNVFVSSFFKILSRLQAHRLVTSQLLSFTIKRSFLLVMNMALIMIILNMNYSSTTPNVADFTFLVQGKYNDLTSDWYLNIGTIIILTMIFNITFPIIELVLANILKCIRKCWDKKFFCRKTSCKTKNQYIQLYNNDIYPIQQRYAFLISIILITLAFSCVIPILNLIFTISIILLYFADRVLIFKVYQTPVNYGSQLHRLVSKTVYLALVAHFALTCVFLSEGSLLASNSTIPGSAERLNSRNNRINIMITNYYIIPYVVMFLLFVGWSVFSNTLLAFCEKCSNLCKKSLSNITKYKLQQTLYQCLSGYQLTKVRLMIEGELSKLTAKANAYRSIRGNKSFFNESIKGLTLELQTNQSQQLNPASEHEALLRRTHMKLKAEETLRKRQVQFGDAHLMGMPCYEFLANDDAFEQNKKNNALSHSLGELLKDVISKMQE